MKDIWGRPNCLGKIEVVVDDDGLPMSADTHMSEFLGTLARNGRYCPIDLEIWPHVRKAHGSEILEVIQVLSNQKKIARNNKKMNHTTGKKPFAAFGGELTMEKGGIPSRVELLDKAYARSDGNSSSVVVNEKLASPRMSSLPQISTMSSSNSFPSGCEAMKAKLNELPPDYDDSVGLNDVFSQVMGKDKPGYVRLYGGNVTPNDPWTETPSRSKLLREKLSNINYSKTWQNKCNTNLQPLLNCSYKSLHRRTYRLTSKVQDTLQQLPTMLQEYKNYNTPGGSQCSDDEYFDMKKTMAKGVLLSVDPKSVVGGSELGDAWYEVYVNVPVVHKERLIRPHYPLVTIHDALGASVAWPTHLVIPDLEDW
ncbi:hypothetical protein OROMI_026514 [Orobanche minor]